MFEGTLEPKSLDPSAIKMSFFTNYLIFLSRQFLASSWGKKPLFALLITQILKMIHRFLFIFDAILIGLIVVIIRVIPTYLPKEIKLVCREGFPSLMMRILDSTLGR